MNFLTFHLRSIFYIYIYIWFLKSFQCYYQMACAFCWVKTTENFVGDVGENALDFNYICLLIN